MCIQVICEVRTCIIEIFLKRASCLLVEHFTSRIFQIKFGSGVLWNYCFVNGWKKKCMYIVKNAYLCCFSPVKMTVHAYCLLICSNLYIGNF